MEFSFKSIEDFDNHISKSICNYKILHELILNIATYFLKDGSSCYDLGCTSGELCHRIKESMPKVNVFGIDSNKSNLKHNDFKFLMKDITKCNFVKKESNLITSIFTLQFIEEKYRLNILKYIYDKLAKGGALIIAEKIYLENGKMQDIFNFSHYDYKRKYFSDKDVLDKQKTLRKIMNPLSESENISYLESAGFKHIESFFQSLNFKGWVCIK